MTIACLVFQKSDIHVRSIKGILLSEFRFKEYEWHDEAQFYFMYVWNVEKIQVWQIVLSFEVSLIKVGYGFGEDMIAAKSEAIEKLEKRLKYDVSP